MHQSQKEIYTPYLQDSNKRDLAIMLDNLLCDLDESQVVYSAMLSYLLLNAP